MAPQTDTDNGLQVSIEEGDAWRRKLVITVPAARVRAVRKKAARQISKRVNLPGFRKGKIPSHILESRFGTDIDRRTQQSLIDDAFEEAIQNRDLEPISEPKLLNISYDPESDFTFEVDFDIRPEITLSRIGDFRVERQPAEVNESAVDKQLEELRVQAALWKPVERKPSAGDSVQVEITNLEEEETGSNPYKFVLGEGRAIPGVEAAIMTLEPGGSDEFSVEFPDDFPEESKRGASQELRIELKAVLERELPPLDDELARSLGDFETLEDLREAIGEDLQREKEREVEADVERQLIENVIEANPFQVPETMVQRYITALLGPPPEGADPEAVRQARDGARPTAVWGIKRTLILQKVAEEQDFEATEEELTERIEAIAERAGRSPADVRARLSKSGDLRDIARRHSQPFLRIDRARRRSLPEIVVDTERCEQMPGGVFFEARAGVQVARMAQHEGRATVVLECLPRLPG